MAMADGGVEVPGTSALRPLVTDDDCDDVCSMWNIDENSN
jgi:hypothetical protein